MKKFLILILATSSLAACKGGGTKKSDIAGGGDGSIGAITAPKERNYTESELKIGRRICASLKNKRELFESITNMQEQFRFRGELKNCINPNPYNNALFTVSISNASSTDFEYVSTTRPNYFRDVITDQTGVMKTICDNLVKSDSVSNHVLVGNSIVAVNFLINEGYDRIELSKKTNDGNGNYTLVSTEGIAIITQSSQTSAKFFGVEKERIRYTACPNSTEVAYTKQTWVEAITSF